ncbi:hypothetical protein VZT92_013766 [Zoarces viviparus]|uniref:Uncharacterized protein n=1 Tax=Zoarces viviparus TaxID=48416 RepID=A0AAW1F4X0_ZOAVI
MKAAFFIWMADGNFTQESEINRHLQPYNNVPIQLVSQPDNERINTREDRCVQLRHAIKKRQEDPED